MQLGYTDTLLLIIGNGLENTARDMGMDLKAVDMFMVKYPYMTATSPWRGSGRCPSGGGSSIGPCCWRQSFRVQLLRVLEHHAKNQKKL
jgi:hypothetical protein